MTVRKNSYSTAWMLQCDRYVRMFWWLLYITEMLTAQIQQPFIILAKPHYYFGIKPGIWNRIYVDNWQGKDVRTEASLNIRSY